MPRTTRTNTAGSSHLTYNHSLIYVTEIERSLEFYRDQLGFRVIDKQVLDGVLVYARLRSPAGNTTIALAAEPGRGAPASGGIRLYFEAKNVEQLCKRLAKSGVRFDQMPKRMPWGWKHAYLRDPDGHELSLYWAGAKRLGKSHDA